MHHCLICTGSNYEYTEKLRNARIALYHHFPTIIFGEEMETDAIGDKWLTPFGNQLGKFTSTLSEEDIRHILKKIESEAGRLSEDKNKGIVRLDIDLLMYDDNILKPDDMNREFVKEGLKKMEQIERISRMEQLLDDVSEAIKRPSIIAGKYEELQQAVNTLTEYYESEEWKQDFADDENGKLPHELKRGVLSEDGIWNVLNNWHELTP